MTNTNLADEASSQVGIVAEILSFRFRRKVVRLRLRIVHRIVVVV
jgi:hypothetical protein